MLARDTIVMRRLQPSQASMPQAPFAIALGCKYTTAHMKAKTNL